MNLPDHSDINLQDFETVRSIIDSHRAKALNVVNRENVLTAWEVGAFISMRLRETQWGSQTVKKLAEFLQTNDPSLRGYGQRNLYNMVEFYECYTSPEVESYINSIAALNARHESEGKILHPLAAKRPAISEVAPILHPLAAKTTFIPKFLLQTTLSNHIVIRNLCKTTEEKIFYVLYAARERLSKRELQRAIQSRAMSNLLGDGHNLSEGMKQTYPQANIMLKDTLMLDFLGLPPQHSEKRLHQSILKNAKDFIQELGKDFLYIGSEYSLEVGGSTFKVDLVYYHRCLQCLVAIELKSTPFKPEYMGQLEFYLEALDRDVRRSNENPSIGILICQESNRMVVEYAMSRSMSPTMVAEYQRTLTPKETMQRSLDEFVGFLTDENNT